MTKKGFTLLEVIIAIALISFIVLLSVKFIAISNDAFVRVELEKFYAFCCYLQRKAKIEHKNQLLFIDVKNNKYACQSCSHMLSQKVTLGILNSVKGPPAQPENTITKPVTFKNDTIVFYPNGTISSGTVYFTDNSKTCLYALSCGVSQVAHLRRYCYKNQWLFIK